MSQSEETKTQNIPQLLSDALNSISGRSLFVCYFLEISL